ncbi:MAG: hypothetical protein F6J94_01235 [Moorea sp. SIO1F2]|nr:hypothetical protein [Moorena sp. SIO1F2]NET80656.1 hypothetical protein [Moorena sp. SIO1F2]
MRECLFPVPYSLLPAPCSAVPCSAVPFAKQLDNSRSLLASIPHPKRQ